MTKKIIITVRGLLASLTTIIIGMTMVAGAAWGQLPIISKGKGKNSDDNITLSGSDGIKWDRLNNNITSLGTSALIYPRLALKSQGNIIVAFKKNKTNEENKIDKVTANTTAHLATDRLDARAEQIDMKFVTAQKNNDRQVVQTINFVQRVSFITERNSKTAKSSNMALYANKATVYRDKKSRLKPPNVVRRNSKKNPFAELQARGAVRLVEEQFNVKGNRVVWFFDDGFGWVYGKTVVVVAKGKKKDASGDGNIVYAKRLLEYNQTDNWARALNGVRVVTKKKETINGQRGYYFPDKEEFIVCGRVVIERTKPDGKKERLEGQCANSNFASGISTMEGKNTEVRMLKIIGAKNILPNDKSLKKLNNNPLDKKGRVRAIIDLEENF